MTVKTDIIAEYTNDTGVTVDGLLIKDGAISAPSGVIVTNATATNYILNLGDSKTYQDDWRELLVAGLNAAGAQQYAVHPCVLFAFNSWRVADIRLAVSYHWRDLGIPAQIATLNVGVNDVWILSEVNFKADYKYIIDLLRAACPGIKIYCAHVWHRTMAAETATINGWISAVIATYATDVYLGMDETIWLEGGDNGATNSTDGVHYSPAGEIAAAAAWRVGILGA